jgi:hypothetical protein
MSAGKGPGRRKGDDAKGYRKNLPEIKGFEKSPDIDKEFEEKFMGKEASAEAEEIPSGKYFMR